MNLYDRTFEIGIIQYSSAGLDTKSVVRIIILLWCNRVLSYIILKSLIFTYI